MSRSSEPGLLKRRGSNRYFWAAEIPWLPDLVATSQASLSGNAVQEAFARQIAFLRAFAAGTATGSGLQLRFSAGPESDRIRCHMVGAADTDRQARNLHRVVVTALPDEYPFDGVATDDLEQLLSYVRGDALQSGHVAEIRRRIDNLDPGVEGKDDEPILFGWTWSPQALLGAIGTLRRQTSRTTLVAHVEPAVLSGDVAVYLQDAINRMAGSLASGDENPSAVAALRGYRRWLRLLPQGCVELRLMLASEDQLTPGLAESISSDLTRSFEAGGETGGTAETVWASTPYELDACASLLDEVAAVAWREPSDPEMSGLLHLFDPLEANTAFRLPVTPRGGLEGIASRRLPSLGRGADVSDTEKRAEFGTVAGSGRFGLTARDLNQHVLVAGLPGFGKSSTTQLLLRRALEDLNLPFLILDPSKRDYEPFMASLADAGHDARVIRLTRSKVAFNPMAIPAGSSPSAFAGRLIAAFDAALDLSRAFPLALIVLSRAIYRLYDTFSEGGAAPTLRDLYRTVGADIRHGQWRGDLRGNLEGSLLARLEFLSTGPTGLALCGGPRDAIDWASIVQRPTLIELGEFGGPADRAIVFALLIASFVSWREANPATSMSHVTVLEEAHRLLRPTGADAGVETMVDAIAELRGAGEGFVIVDQTPSLLHPGVLKLTGTKLAHRLVEFGERAAVASSMVLDHAQAEDLARLASQRCCAYVASGSGAVLVDVDSVDETRLDELALPVSAELVDDPRVEPLYCVRCPVMCAGPVSIPKEGRSALNAASRTPRALLTAAKRITGNNEKAFCLSARFAAASSLDRPARMRELIDALVDDYASLAPRSAK